MAHFIIENFANGLDLRRAHDVAPPGSLRTLNNAFINPGGEIEKRKAFSLNAVLTAYGQTGNYKGRITGPFIAAAGASLVGLADRPNVVVFRHRHNSLPGGSFSAGVGSAAEKYDISTKPPMRAWAMKATGSLGAAFGSLLHVNSSSLFSNFAYLVEQYYAHTFTLDDNQNMEIEFSTTNGSTDEPITETRITANDNFPFEYVLKSKGYIAGGNTFKASAVLDPGDMVGTGSGAIDVRTQSTPIGPVVALNEYFGQLAVFGQRGVQFWEVDADFDANQYLRTVPISALAPRSVIAYGDGDLVYLGRNGIRSLKARDSSNLAAVDDVGSPIDKLISVALDGDSSVSETTDSVSVDLARNFDMPLSVIHPSSGQLWVFVKETIYVLSVHPDAKVRAWSTFDMPTVTPANISTRNGTLKSRWCADACPISDDVIFRNFADEVFIYGGTDSGTYDTSTVEVITPHMDLGKPGLEKTLHGFDIACTGTWTLEVSLNPNNIVWEAAGTFTNSTFSPSGRIPFESTFTHIALRLTNTVAEQATVGQVVIYYTGGDER